MPQPVLFRVRNAKDAGRGPSGNHKDWPGELDGADRQAARNGRARPRIGREIELHRQDQLGLGRHVQEAESGGCYNPSMSVTEPTAPPAALDTLCVYCGSSPGQDPVFAATARRFGALVAGRGLRLVFGGGHVGLMGALSDGALEAGGQVVGVIPRALVGRELAHRRVQKLHVVETMHERKALMERLSDAFVALPGGIGTLDELFELARWAPNHHLTCPWRFRVIGPAALERLKEAAKLGFTHALVPKANAPKQAVKGIEVIALERVEQAIDALRSLRES